MNQPFDFAPTLHVLALVFSIISGLLGMIAMVSPRLFRWLSGRSSQWIDSSRALQFLDKRVDIDHYFLRHARLFGAVLVVTLAAAWIVHAFPG